MVFLLLLLFLNSVENVNVWMGEFSVTRNVGLLTIFPCFFIIFSRTECKNFIPSSMEYCKGKFISISCGKILMLILLVRKFLIKEILPKSLSVLKCKTVFIIRCKSTIFSIKLSNINLKRLTLQTKWKCNKDKLIMINWTQRTELLIGAIGLERLKSASVLVVGLGGVGGMAAEMLCRAGVGHFTLIDRDIVTETNINRQIIALTSTVGKNKTDVLAMRLREINPQVKLNIISEWLDEKNMQQILFSNKFDYVVDAIDTLSPKVFLIKTCIENNIKIISSMGAGSKLDPLQIKIDDISKTNYCPLAKTVRKRLSKMGIKKGVKVVYSTESSDKESVIETDEKYKKSTNGTISYLPALFGIMVASVVIRELIEKEK